MLRCRTRIFELSNNFKNPSRGHCSPFHDSPVAFRTTQRHILFTLTQIDRTDRSKQNSYNLLLWAFLRGLSFMSEQSFTYLNPFYLPPEDLGLASPGLPPSTFWVVFTSLAAVNRKPFQYYHLYYDSIHVQCTYLRIFKKKQSHKNYADP